MTQPRVMVSKEELTRILGPSMINFALFMTGDTPTGKAVRLLYENTGQFDLNDPFVKDSLIPLLVANGALSESDVAVISQYVADLT
jgi:uncharacterized UBP type Zn finger protein